MKVVFVYRGYGEDGANSVIDFQRLSLVKAGIIVLPFPVKGGGIKNYINALFALRKFIKRECIDIVHAHYSLSGLMAGFSGGKPVICSLMGSDILRSGKLAGFITWLFYKFVWSATIVKSPEMHKLFPAAQLIPNGVDFDNFRPVDRDEAIARTGFNGADINIIFVAEDPNAAVKNLSLARAGIKLLGNENIKLHLVSGKPFAELPYYYNAADILLMTSLSEGSPNVIKEAMACNCPVVATDVGDIRQVIGNTAGCFITNFDATDLAAKLNLALSFGNKTNGRQAVEHLDSKHIVVRLTDLYNNVLSRKKGHRK